MISMHQYGRHLAEPWTKEGNGGYEMSHDARDLFRTQESVKPRKLCE